MNEVRRKLYGVSTDEGKPLCLQYFEAMKRYGDLFDRIVEIDNLRLAFNKASRHKHNRKAVKKIEKNLDYNLQWLREGLLEGTIHTSDYHTKEIYEPKKRTIYILPFWPDRVVQHAVLNVLAPYWEKLLIKDTYSCLEGRGQHKGSLRTEQFVKHYRYVYKADVKQFYPSLNHNILKKIIRKKLKDKRLLALLDDIIDSYPGEVNVPIGNLMSQWFGNLYMNEYDMFVKHVLHCKAYIRFCDDFTLYSNNEDELRNWKKLSEDFIRENLSLTLGKSEIFPTSRGVDFLGYRHFPDGYLLVRKSTAKKAKRRVTEVRNAMAEGTIAPETARGKVESTYGLISWANSFNFMQSLDMEGLREEAKNYDELCRSGKETADK